MVVIKEIPLVKIRRPLPKQTDPNKVMALMDSIAQEGLKEPIDVLEVEGNYYGFSGCHRYEAHQRLGKETIKCRVRHAPLSVLKKHLA
ncbi:MAG TPA: chromosome partitioning protein ParB [Cyanothece sp. UBA12306]|nr:chromosome partitioning protein ParB [Cyanothece sp. UBA12306]